MSDTYTNAAGVLTANFSTAAGQSPALQVPAGESVSISLSGTYAATVQLEQATSGAQQAWQVPSNGGPFSTANATVTFTYTAPGGPEAFTYIRFNCTGYTSGTAVATATLVAKQTITLEDQNGAPILTGSPSGVNFVPPLTASIIDAGAGVVAGGVTAAFAQTPVAGKVNLLSALAGTTSTLPAATGSGKLYRFVNSVAPTSNAHVITCSAALSTFQGSIIEDKSGVVTAYSATAGATGTGSDTISLNGTTTGGLVLGDYIEVQDIGVGVYAVKGLVNVSGTQATPFSTVA